jgi:hypothetical protein
MANIQTANKLESRLSTVNSKAPSLPTGSDGKRETMKEALRAGGGDAASVAARLVQLMGATEPKWNPSTKTWDRFPDNEIRLAAVHEINRLSGSYPEGDEEKNSVVLVLPKNWEDEMPTRPENAAP